LFVSAALGGALVEPWSSKRKKGFLREKLVLNKMLKRREEGKRKVKAKGKGVKKGEEKK
jgi:hypothetical protein